MAHPEFDALLNALLPFAQKMLEEHGAFLPFAASLAGDDSIEMVAGAAGGEAPGSRELIDRLSEGLRERARDGCLRAAGLCYHAQFTPEGEVLPMNAICASLDRAAGEPLNVLVPYDTSHPGAPRYGDLICVPGTIRLFPYDA